MEIFGSMNVKINAPLTSILTKNEYLPGQCFSKQALESLADPEQGDPPYFSTWVLVLVLDDVPPVPHNFEQIEKSDQVDHSQFTENNKERFCFNCQI